MNFSVFRHRGVWVHHRQMLDQVDISEAIDHVLAAAAKKSVPIPPNLVIRFRKPGWSEHGAKQQVAVWHDRFFRWCEVNVVVATKEETWKRTLVALSGAIVSETAPKLGLKALV